jgi:hypothetical protein
MLVSGQFNPKITVEDIVKRENLNSKIKII